MYAVDVTDLDDAELLAVRVSFDQRGIEYRIEEHWFEEHWLEEHWLEDDAQHRYLLSTVKDHDEILDTLHRSSIESDRTSAIGGDRSDVLIRSGEDTRPARIGSVRFR